MNTKHVCDQKINSIKQFHSVFKDILSLRGEINFFGQYLCRYCYAKLLLNFVSSIENISLDKFYLSNCTTKIHDIILSG